MNNLGVAIAGGGRSGNGRIANDFYPTPRSAFDALAPFVTDFPNTIWEPSCGDGAMSLVIQEHGRSVVSSDLIDRGFGRTGIDFLTASRREADAIITNPPFVLAADFIEHASALGVPYLALLLKSTFWHAERRRALFERWPVHTIHPLTWRLDFTGKGAPTMDCSWFVWRPGAGGTGYVPLARPAIKPDPRRLGLSDPNEYRDDDDDAPPTLCGVCYEPQVDTPAGLTCCNGHGGAEPMPDFML